MVVLLIVLVRDRKNVLRTSLIAQERGASASFFIIVASSRVILAVSVFVKDRDALAVAVAVAVTVVGVVLSLSLSLPPSSSLSLSSSNPVRFVPKPSASNQLVKSTYHFSTSQQFAMIFLYAVRIGDSVFTGREDSTIRADRQVLSNLDDRRGSGSKVVETRDGGGLPGGGGFFDEVVTTLSTARMLPSHTRRTSSRVVAWGRRERKDSVGGVVHQ